MSVSFTAYAAIGCKVPVEKAKREVRHRGCKHEIVVANQSNCPYCGATTWTESVEWIFPLNDDEEIIVGEGLEAIFSTDDEELIIAALSVKAHSYYGECEMVALVDGQESYKGRVRLFLEPLGLWDESLFGLWAVPYVSY